MFKAKLIERAAHFRKAEGDPTRKLESCPALVLNADYTPLSYYPLSLWPWQTEIKAVFLERVDIVASYERQVHSPSLYMQIPSVIALRQFVRPSEFPAFTRFNVFLRDRFSCQYCGSPQHLTFDHVVPRRLGGKTKWENILTACAPCNLRKGGRTPRQAQMRPPRHATSGKAAARRGRRRCARWSIRSGRPAGSCSSTARASRPTTCTKPGVTGSTGISNWKNSQYTTARTA